MDGSDDNLHAVRSCHATQINTDNLHKAKLTAEWKLMVPKTGNSSFLSLLFKFDFVSD